MKFEVGDKVVVRLTNEDGVVVEVLNEKMVVVEVRGVRFPAYTDQLDFPYFKLFSKQFSAGRSGGAGAGNAASGGAGKVTGKPAGKAGATEPGASSRAKTYIDQVPKEKTRDLPKQTPNGVWLIFIPQYQTDEFGDDIVSNLKIHLHNQNNEAYNFHYQLSYFGETDFELKNEVMPYQDFYLHDIPFSDLNDSPAWHFEFALKQPVKGKAGHYETTVKPKPKQVFRKVQEIQEKGQPFFSYELFRAYPDGVEEPVVELGRLAAAGYKVYPASQARQHLPPARTLVDLHIEKLTDNWQRMSNAEILQLQVDTFEKFFELALAHQQPTLTVIHGVGSGRLRDEIHDILRHRRTVKSFVNQYDPRYGYGATEIYFNN